MVYMKYLKKFNNYSKINEEEEISKGEMLAFQLRDYKNKQNNLKSLILNNIDTDKDIDKAYNDITEENPFLQKHGQIFKIEAGIQKAQNRLSENEESTKKLQEDGKLVNNLSDDTDKEGQLASIEERIKGKADEKKTIEERIKELEQQHRDLEEELKVMIKEKELELREIQKSPFNQ